MLHDNLVKIMISFLCLSLFAFFSLSFPANVYCFELPMRHYTADDGLVQNDVITVFQDHKGYLWFGTYGGVSRFDGKNYTNFDEDAGLKGSIVRSIVEDTNHCLWVGYTGGIGRLENSLFVHYGEEQGLIGEDTQQLWADSHNGIWIVTEIGVNYFDGNTFTFYPLEGIIYKNNSFITGSDDGEIFIASRKGLYKWNTEKKEFAHLSVVTFPVAALQYNNKGNELYLIDGAALYRLKDNKLTSVAHSPLELPLINFFIGADQSLWLFSQDQLWHYNPLKPDSPLGQRVYSSHNLQGSSISGGLEDREGNIWLTRWGGVSIILDSQIHNYRRFLAGKIATALAKDSSGNLWVGGEHGIVKLSPSGEKLLMIDTSYVEDFFLDEQSGQIFAATEEGVQLFDFKGKLLHVAGPEEAITRVVKDSRGKVWVGTYSGLFSLAHEDLILEMNTSQGLGSNTIWSIHEDRKGLLWFGTEKGLSSFNGHTWKHYSMKDGLSHHTIWSHIEHPYWGMLIGTRKGITSYKNDQFAHLPALARENIHSLGVDINGKLWVGTEKGLFRINKSMETEIFFNKTLGLASNSVYNNKMLFDNSHVYVGTYAGVSRIEVESKRTKIVGPLLDIHSIELNRNLYSVNEFPTNLEHFQKSLTFSFNSVYMYFPQKVRYRYYLSGLESKWSPFKEIPQAAYTNLPHGDYAFNVQAFAESGKKSPVQTLKFTIKKPFWLEIWFIICEVIAALSFIALVIRFFVYRSVKKSEAAKERIQAQYEKQLKLDKLKDEFLANTSHELRTPLNGIIGITESLIDGSAGPLSHETKVNLSMVVSSGRRLANLVNDILDFSKMKNQDLTLKRGPVDVRCIADIVLNLTRPLIGQKPVTLINNIPETLSLVHGDENRIQQILYNLIDNAIKFTHKGQIDVSANDDNDLIYVSVSDTGIGIPENRREQIFEYFEQADGSIAREYGGTGLGLAVTKKLVEMHGGSLWVSSTQEGSIFTFSLPRSKDEQVHGKPKPHHEEYKIVQKFSLTDTTLEVPEKNKKAYQSTLLVVDDETVNLQVLKNYLSFYYRVLTAQDGFEALAILEKEKPDLIILDLMMPRMSGYELSTKIRQTYDPIKLPIVLLTAKNQISDLVQGMESGANDYLIKPFNKDELVCRIKTHLRLAYINRAYERFVPHEFLEFLRKESIIDVQLGDCIEETMSVMFADIRSFTTIAEHMNPQANFDFLNAYLSHVGPVIRQHHGFIDKYIGDAIMALFNRGADDALAASVAMLHKLDIFNVEREKQGLDPVFIGIGINTGSLMLGIIGEHNRMEGTVISDAVNVASRIEGMTKVYGAQLLLTEETIDSLKNRSQYTTRLIDRVRVKGKMQPVTVWEVLEGCSEEVMHFKAAIASRFEEALSLYFKGELYNAQRLFKECLTIYPDDLASQVYIERCAHNIKAGYDETWDGVTQLEYK